MNFPRKLSISFSYSDLLEESFVECSYRVLVISTVSMVISSSYFCVCTLLSASSPTYLFPWLDKFGTTSFVSLSFPEKLLCLCTNWAVFLFAKKPISVLIWFFLYFSFSQSYLIFFLLISWYRCLCIHFHLFLFPCVNT